MQRQGPATPQWWLASWRGHLDQQWLGGHGGEPGSSLVSMWASLGGGGVGFWPVMPSVSAIRSGGASRFWRRGRGVVAIGVLVAVWVLGPVPAGAQQPEPSRSCAVWRWGSHSSAGIHQGVDFACFGRAVKAALDGRVVAAVGDYTTPSSQDLEAVLATTFELGVTPPYTLIMLYSNYVVIDHGMIDGVGRVASLYTHLDAVEHHPITSRLQARWH